MAWRSHRSTPLRARSADDPSAHPSPRGYTITGQALRRHQPNHPVWQLRREPHLTPYQESLIDICWPAEDELPIAALNYRQDSAPTKGTHAV